MMKTFKYIQNDDVYKAFLEMRNTILKERPVIIARHGDYTLYLKCVSENVLGITIRNSERDKLIQDRSYDITSTTPELVSRGVRHACQKMQELSDKDVNRRRLQIWKWYIMDWQQENAGRTKEIVERELAWEDEQSEELEVMDMESYLHGAYLNLGKTISLIEKYLSGDDKHLEQFRKFVINDIMEMTSEDTREKSLAEAEARRLSEGMKKHTYQFTVSVEATDREHARQALMSYLAGDERIKIQK